MSGFVAAVRKIADPELEVHVRGMSQKISHRGDRETLTAMSHRCLATSLTEDGHEYEFRAWWLSG
jgi:hypothetical protein